MQCVCVSHLFCVRLCLRCVSQLFSLSPLLISLLIHPHIYSKSLSPGSYCSPFCECTVQYSVPPHQADCFLSGCTTVGAPWGPGPSHLNICPSHYRSCCRTRAPFTHADSNAGENGNDIQGNAGIPGCLLKAPDYVSQLVERCEESPGGVPQGTR